jgi:glyoxylase-like metal-dependent hydrolase (beta-lactamase superfamily II)
VGANITSAPGAIAQFTDTAKSAIWASSYDKPFVNEENRLPTNSLCRFFDIETPKYEVTHWADDGQHVFAGESGEDLGLVIYHTPGHTPDELAVWDPQERVIFVGDTMYEWVHIVFPLEGDLRLYSNTLGKLRSLVAAWNSGRNRQNTGKWSSPATCLMIRQC